MAGARNELSGESWQSTYTERNQMETMDWWQQPRSVQLLVDNDSWILDDARTLCDAIMAGGIIVSYVAMSRRLSRAIFCSCWVVRNWWHPMSWQEIDATWWCMKAACRGDAGLPRCSGNYWPGRLRSRFACWKRPSKPMPGMFTCEIG